MNRLQFWRYERKLSQIELAAEAVVPRHRIQLCEQGICLPKPDEQERLAAALGVTPEELFPTYSAANGKTVGRK